MAVRIEHGHPIPAPAFRLRRCLTARCIERAGVPHLQATAPEEAFKFGRMSTHVRLVFKQHDASLRIFFQPSLKACDAADLGDGLQPTRKIELRVILTPMRQRDAALLQAG